LAADFSPASAVPEVKREKTAEAMTAPFMASRIMVLPFVLLVVLR
jgi:hypothetical protein